MIGKKCPKCGKKVKRDYDFCPHCGLNLRREKDKENYGLLGRNDLKDDFFNPNMGNFGMGMGLPNGFNKIFKNLMSQIDREFREMDKRIGRERSKKKKAKSRGISINISSGSNKKPEIRVSGYGPGFKGKRKRPRKKGKKIKKKKKVKKPKISEKKAKEMADLPREEAETNVRRLSDRIVYEIKLPGVKKTENLSINKLENSIEIKAVSGDKVYFKLLPVSLPIENYKLKDGELILELRQE